MYLIVNESQCSVESLLLKSYVWALIGSLAFRDLFELLPCNRGRQKVFQSFPYVFFIIGRPLWVCRPPKVGLDEVAQSKRQAVNAAFLPRLRSTREGAATPQCKTNRITAINRVPDSVPPAWGGCQYANATVAATLRT